MNVGLERTAAGRHVCKLHLSLLVRHVAEGGSASARDGHSDAGYRDNLSGRERRTNGRENGTGLAVDGSAAEKGDEEGYGQAMFQD